jgi:hypothetical protein
VEEYDAAAETALAEQFEVKSDVVGQRWFATSDDNGRQEKLDKRLRVRSRARMGR